MMCTAVLSVLLPAVLLRPPDGVQLGLTSSRCPLWPLNGRIPVTSGLTLPALSLMISTWLRFSCVGLQSGQAIKFTTWRDVSKQPLWSLFWHLFPSMNSMTNVNYWWIKHKNTHSCTCVRQNKDKFSLASWQAEFSSKLWVKCGGSHGAVGYFWDVFTCFPHICHSPELYFAAYPGWSPPFLDVYYAWKMPRIKNKHKHWKVSHSFILPRVLIWDYFVVITLIFFSFHRS